MAPIRDDDPGSGSETETDSELYDEPLATVPTSAASEAFRTLAFMNADDDAAPEDHGDQIPEPANQPEEQCNTVAAVETLPTKQEEPTILLPTATMNVVSTAVTTYSYDSDDDERPIFTSQQLKPPPAATTAAAVKASHLPSLGLFRPTTPAPVEIGSCSSAPRTHTAQPTVAALPNQTMAAPPPNFPTETDFVSPFSSLATSYQLPPPSVYGAAPASYVPLPVGATTATTTATVATPGTVPCSTCTRAVTTASSPIPLATHGACTCCGRYFLHINLRTREGGQARYCSVCVTPPASALSKCNLCFKTLLPMPPASASDSMQCQCCMQEYSPRAFSKQQQKRGRLFWRCVGCLKPGITPSKFNNMGKKRDISAADPATLTAKQRKALRRATQSTHQGPAQLTEQQLIQKTTQGLIQKLHSATERREMEIHVRNFKVARRSIQRRREANDLRGSTRVEYNEQLQKGEDALNAKIARIRRGNPTLYNEIDQSIRVKAAAVPQSERDRPGKRKTTPKQKPPRKPRAAAQQRQAPAPQKRPRSAAIFAGCAAPVAKRSRASSGAPVPLVKGETKAASSVTATSVLPGTALKKEERPAAPPSPLRRFPSRPQTRANKPIEIIDLINSN